MARFLSSAARSLFSSGSSSSSSSSSFKTLATLLLPFFCSSNRSSLSSILQRRNYITEMRKSALEGNILRILRSEIQYEKEYAPLKEPVTVFNSFVVEDKPGEQWIKLKGNFGDNEDIKIEVTMFDGSIPIKGSDNEVQLHISLIVDVLRRESCNVLEFICSAWPEELVIEKVFVLNKNGMQIKPYMGPQFKELDDEMQDLFHDFLDERGVNDELAIFLHEYMMNKDKTEFIRWMQKVKTFVEN